MSFIPFGKDTEKFHKVDDNGMIVEEKFTSVFRIFGMKIHRGNHTYRREGGEIDSRLGFKPNTRDENY